MHMSSQQVCSLIPFPPHSVPPQPGWAPLPPPQSSAPRWSFPNPSGVWYHPHIVGQHQGVCVCWWVCGVVWCLYGYVFVVCLIWFMSQGCVQCALESLDCCVDFPFYSDNSCSHSPWQSDLIISQLVVMTFKLLKAGYHQTNCKVKLCCQEPLVCCEISSSVSTDVHTVYELTVVL